AAKSGIRGVRVGRSLRIAELRFPSGGRGICSPAGLKLDSAGCDFVGRASELVWQQENLCGARFQPCHKASEMRRALAPGGSEHELSYRLFSLLPLPQVVALSVETRLAEACPTRSKAFPHFFHRA